MFVVCVCARLHSVFLPFCFVALFSSVLSLFPFVFVAALDSLAAK